MQKTIVLLTTLCSSARLFRRVVAATLFTCFLTAAGAQQPPDSVLTRLQNRPPKAPDTSKLYYTLAASPEQRIPVGDSMPDQEFRQYDPARQQLIDWGTLGILGASGRPLLFETAYRKGFDTGIHAFDLYRLDPAGLRYYRNSRTFSDLYFTQGQTQNDNMLRAKMSRTFAGGLCFALDYWNFNNIGQFRYQTAKHSAISTGIWWPVSKRYQVFLNFTRNSNRQQDGGGIVTDTIFKGDQFSGPITANIRLPDADAQTKISDWTIKADQHFDFGKTGNRTFRAVHSLSTGKQQYKFFDTNLNADTLFFDTFMVDVRGIRNYIEVSRLENRFELLTFKSKRPERTSDLLGVGLSHAYFRLRQEPADSVINNIFLTGRLAITPSAGFSLTADGALGMLGNFGEYNAGGELKIGLGKAGELKVALSSQRTPPSLLSYRLFVSQRPFWNNTFAKPVASSLSASYALPLLGLELTGKTHLVNNYLYFDQKGLAAQTTSPLQVVQLIGTLNLKLGPIRFDNTLALQSANRNDVFRLPPWFTKNSLYYSGKLFKGKMDIRLGADFHMNGEFRPDAYHPLLWQFHLQDSLTQKPYPWLDGFISIKIKTFRFFFRYENIAMVWDPGTVYYQTAWHPQRFNSFRLGIGWRFMDENTGKPDDKKPGSNSGSSPGQGLGRNR